MKVKTTGLPASLTARGGIVQKCPVVDCPYSNDETEIKEHPKAAKKLKTDDILKSSKEKQINAEIAAVLC